ncbi:hypothetical protein Tco_0295517 [Tanacetum coccineum]
MGALETRRLSLNVFECGQRLPGVGSVSVYIRSGELSERVEDVGQTVAIERDIYKRRRHQVVPVSLRSRCYNRALALTDVVRRVLESGGYREEVERR